MLTNDNSTDTVKKEQQIMLQMVSGLLLFLNV